VKQAFTFNPV